MLEQITNSGSNKNGEQNWQKEKRRIEREEEERFLEEKIPALQERFNTFRRAHPEWNAIYCTMGHIPLGTSPHIEIRFEHDAKKEPLRIVRVRDRELGDAAAFVTRIMAEQGLRGTLDNLHGDKSVLIYRLWRKTNDEVPDLYGSHTGDEERDAWS